MMDGAEQILVFPERTARPPRPQEMSGVTLGSQAIFKYALKESEYPTLIIVEPISDGFGNTIPAGHYELALADEWDFLIMMQSKKPIAILHTFKVQEDKSAYDKPSKKLKKIKEKEAKAREKTNKARAEVGMSPDEEKIHMEASIEYIKDGNYYLIKYERGAIRAWGAIKAN